LGLGLKMMKVAKFHYLWLWMQGQFVSVVETVRPGLEENSSDSSKLRGRETNRGEVSKLHENMRLLR
jgi:hypothetical protein